MPVKSVEVGWECLQDEFHKLMDVAKKKKDHDDIFDQLKGAVVDTAVSKHVWEDKAAEVLKVIQLNTLEDRCVGLFEFSTYHHFCLRSVHDKQHWDGAIKFLSDNLSEKIVGNDKTLAEMLGPGWWERWSRWRSCSPEQQSRAMARQELEKILAADPDHGPHLGYEVTQIGNNKTKNKV